MHLIYGTVKVRTELGMTKYSFSQKVAEFGIKPHFKGRENFWNLLHLVPLKIGYPSEKWIFEEALHPDDEGIYFGFCGSKEIRIDLIEMFDL